MAGNYGERNVVYLNTDQPNLLQNPVSATALQVMSLAAGDVDGDGDLDLIAGNNSADPKDGNRLYRNDGAGRFTVMPPLHVFSTTIAVPLTDTVTGSIADTTMAVALADLNGDAALNLITGNARAPNLIYFNDRTGDNLFSRRPVPFGPASDDTWSLAVGDLNGDQAPDIVVGNYGQPNAVYLNNGKGGFPADAAHKQTFGKDGDRTTGVALADFNGDGALDLTVGAENQEGALYLNDGQGRFPANPASRFGTDQDNVKQIAVGDLNGDGAPDLVAASFTAPNAIYLGDGKGNLLSAQTLGEPNRNQTYSVALADLQPGWRVGYLLRRLGHHRSLGAFQLQHDLSERWSRRLFRRTPASVHARPALHAPDHRRRHRPGWAAGRGHGRPLQPDHRAMVE